MLERPSGPGEAAHQPALAAPPTPSTSASAAATPLDDPRALQILSTEHWSLLATRSLSWNESFARAGLFLSVLSATAVALALVAQAASFKEGFVAFALVMLPVDLFIGLVTFTRLNEVNNEDVLWVAGMNRIRHAYTEIGPGLERYFISGTSDDDAGIERTYGIHRPGNALAHWLVTMPGMIAFIDGILAGLIAGLVVMLAVRMDVVPSIVVGSAVGIIVTIVLATQSRSSFVWLKRAYRPAFSSGRPSFVVRSLGDSDRGKKGSGEPSA